MDYKILCMKVMRSVSGTLTKLALYSQCVGIAPHNGCGEKTTYNRFKILVGAFECIDVSKVTDSTLEL